MSDTKKRIKGNSMQDLKSISEIFTQRIFRIPDYQRGLKLLSFMEERWGIPIKNEQKKREFLFLGGR